MRKSRKKTAQKKISVADPSIHNGLRSYQTAFIEWTETIGLSAQTAATRQIALDYFIQWCDERGLSRPQDITRPMLEQYQRHLYHYRKANGQSLTYGTQLTRLNPLKAFFKWLTRENHILYNPASELILPRLPRRLPQRVLSREEVEAVLSQADVTTLAGIRERAVMELFYSTAIRRMELLQLKVFDVQIRQGTLMVRQGKGRRDRVVPVGQRALAWLTKYLNEVRPQLLTSYDDGTLFLTDEGQAYEKGRLGDMVRRRMREAGIAQGACHAFRHACATHMLENGADIRFIQAMLGHAELSTTQIYTQVSIVKLQEIHAATHPARLTRIKNDMQEIAIDAEKQTLLDALEIEDSEEEAS